MSHGTLLAQWATGLGVPLEQHSVTKPRFVRNCCQVLGGADRVEGRDRLVAIDAEGSIRTRRLVHSSSGHSCGKVSIQVAQRTDAAARARGALAEHCRRLEHTKECRTRPTSNRNYRHRQRGIGHYVGIGSEGFAAYRADGLAVFSCFAHRVWRHLIPLSP